MKKIIVLSIIFILLSIFLFVTDYSGQNSILPSKQGNISTNKTLQVPQEIQEKKDFSQLTQSYNQILATTQAEFGITFLDLKTGEKLFINGEKTFHAASTSKAIVGAYALKQVDEQKLSLDENISGLTLSERIRLMINISDNDSWEALLNYFGISTIQNFSRGLDLSATNHFDNTSTADDLAKFLEKIYKNEVLSQKNKNYLLAFMQNTEKEDRITAGIPSKNLVFHKGGTYNGEIHDIGIIAHPKNPFVLAILSDGKNDLDARPKILAGIAKASWEFAEGKL